MQISPTLITISSVIVTRDLIYGHRGLTTDLTTHCYLCFALTRHAVASPTRDLNIFACFTAIHILFTVHTKQQQQQRRQLGWRGIHIGHVLGLLINQRISCASP